MDKIINLLINNWTKGVDTYTHNGSTWLIFTEQRSWVIELTQDKTLWYNYNFFKELFSLTSMDVVDNQHHITKWVEDNVIGGVNHTEYGDWLDGDERLDEIVENGVKETNHVDVMIFMNNKMENTLKNGVKFTLNTEFMPKSMVEDIIENGVKSSIPRQYVGKDIIDKIIDKGVIETHDDVYHNKGRIDGVIKNGVKETKVCNYKDPNTNLVYVRWPEDIEEVIYNGTKNPSV